MFTLALFFHRLHRFFAEGVRIIGDHRVKRRVHCAHFFLMVDHNIAAGEGAVDKELSGGDGTLQAIGIGVNAVRRRAFSAGDQTLLRQPLAHIVPHIHFQNAALGGELAARNFPRRPRVWRRLLQHAAVSGKRCTKVVTAHHQHLLKLIPILGRCRGARARGNAQRRERYRKKRFLHPYFLIMYLPT